MADEKSSENSSSGKITRRGFLGKAALAGGGFALGRISKPEGSTIRKDNPPLLASESRRASIPSVVVRQEVHIGDEGLTALAQKDPLLGYLVDAPTDWITLYLEKMSERGSIPDEKIDRIRGVIDSTVNEVNKILGELNE